MTNNPMTYLKETIDPMIAAASDENPYTDDEFLSIIGIDVLDRVPEGDIVELYGAYSDPAVYVGDRFMYNPSERAISFGKMKLKKMTITIRVNEDELLRMMRRGLDSITQKMIKRQMKDQVMYLRENLIKFCMGQSAIGTEAAGEDRDPLIYGFFDPSSGGTISNPSDLATAAGTREDLTAIKWGGANQTERNIAAFISGTIHKFTKIDYLTHIKLPKSQIYYLVHPLQKAHMDSTYDILEATNLNRSPNTQTQDLANAGIKTIETAWVDVTYANGDDEECFSCLFMGPDNFTIWLIKQPDGGDGWSEWEKVFDGKSKFFVKTKKLEFGLETQAFALHTSATAHSYWKMVMPLKTDPWT